MLSEQNTTGVATARALTEQLAEIRVLLVEDNEEAAELNRAFLNEDSQDPFAVDWCDSLTQAMIKLGKPNQYEVVLLDLGMPELHGYKSLRAIQSMSSPIPVVILTGDETKLTRDLIVGRCAPDADARKGQVRAYLIKGRTTGAELRTAVRQAAQG